MYLSEQQQLSSSWPLTVPTIFRRRYRAWEPSMRTAQNQWHSLAKWVILCIFKYTANKKYLTKYKQGVSIFCLKLHVFPSAIKICWVFIHPFVFSFSFPWIYILHRYIYIYLLNESKTQNLRA
jgi:hypothetical protein